jgi:hypothetical protein
MRPPESDTPFFEKPPKEQATLNAELRAVVRDRRVDAADDTVIDMTAAIRRNRNSWTVVEPTTPRSAA